MTGILAASHANALVKITQSIPFIVVYLATFGVAGFGIFKLSEDGNIIWHKILPFFMFILGLAFDAAIPKAGVKISGLSAVKDRVPVDIVLILLLLVALVFTILENKGGEGGGPS